MSKQEPGRHHYLPEFYLRAWCKPNGPLIRYVNERGIIRTREFYPGGVGYRTDLYKLNTESITDRHQIEKQHFEQLDSASALVITKMIADPLVRLSKMEREKVATFVLSLPARNPWGIAMGRAIARNSYVGELSDPQHGKALGLPIEKTTFQTIEESNPHFVNDMTLITMLEASNDPTKIERVAGMHWKVWDMSHASNDLIVGDRAFLTYGNLHTAEKTVVAIPLSPTRLLTTSDVPLKPLSPSEMAKIVNKQSVFRAVEHVYAGNRNHIPLARKHLRQRVHERPDLLDF